MKTIDFPISSKEEAEALIERMRSHNLSEADREQLVKSLEFHLHVQSSVRKATSMKHLLKLLARPFSKKGADAASL